MVILNKTRNLLLAATVGLAISVASYSAKATDIDVDGLLITRIAITLLKNTDMDFGGVDYAAVNSGVIEMGTDGVRALNTPVGLTLSGTSTAGDVDITGEGTATVDISCETGGVLRDAGDTLSLTLQTTEISTTAVAFGVGTACAGLGTTPLSVALVGGALTVLMGGAIDIGTNLAVSDSFTTAAGTGANPVTLRVVYQ